MASFLDLAKNAFNRSAAFLGFSIGSQVASDAGIAARKAVQGDIDGAGQALKATTSGITNPDKTLIQNVAAGLDFFTAGLATQIVNKDLKGIVSTVATIASVTKAAQLDPSLTAAIQRTAGTGYLARAGQFATTKVALPLAVADTAVDGVNNGIAVLDAVKRGDYPAAVWHQVQNIPGVNLMTGAALDMAGDFAEKTVGYNPAPAMKSVVRDAINTVVDTGYQGYEAVRAKLVGTPTADTGTELPTAPQRQAEAKPDAPKREAAVKTISAPTTPT